MRFHKLSVLAGIAAAVLPVTAFAHGGHAGDHDFLSGITHPLLGTDHLLAMVAVAMWAAIVAPKRFWIAPLGFMAGMAAGALAGLAGFEIPGMELAIAGSITVFGLCAAGRVSLPMGISAAIAAGFGAVHGLAHGLEYAGAPEAAYLFMAGMLIATAGLHLAGAMLGLGLTKVGSPRYARLGGAAFAVAGLVLMAGQVLPV